MAIAVGGEAGGVQSGINMTPMIDILLVLLIVFMAISPLSSKGLEALAPQSAIAGTQVEERAVVIQIDKSHNWMINREPVAEGRLEARLLDIFKARADRVVFVKGDRNWKTGGWRAPSITPTAPTSTKSG